VFGGVRARGAELDGGAEVVGEGGVGAVELRQGVSHPHCRCLRQQSARFILPAEDPLRALRSGGRTVAYAGVVANLTGNSAMSVPLSWNGAGLPIGVHFLGRYGDEATLLRLAGQLESARVWAQLAPRAGLTDR
jgi:hypothetical protein